MAIDRCFNVADFHRLARCRLPARGSHVLKALALGAKACSMGRPYLYALAAGGEAGVMRLLGRLRAEIDRDMALMGCTNITQVARNKVERI